MLNETILAERGYYEAINGVCGYAGLNIWRPDLSEKHVFRGKSVGEFLSDASNQSGAWLIDVGWGGPSGPIRVRWVDGEWVNDGFPPWPMNPPT